MKRILTNYRYYVVALVGIVATLLLVAFPDEHLPFGAFCAILLLMKFAAFALYYTLYLLIAFWAPQMPELWKLIDEEE